MPVNVSPAESPLKKSPVKPSSQTRCAALDASRKLCNAPTKQGITWCPRHNEERLKLYANYKSHHMALDHFPAEKTCAGKDEVTGCTSLDVLQDWNRALLSKYKLLIRCIGARKYFTERFFGNDMDFGHKTYWDFLLKQRDELEDLLAAVQKRGYQLILTKQNALWVLEKQSEEIKAAKENEDCTGHASTPLIPKGPMGIPDIVDEEEDVEDPLDVALREKAYELREKIRSRLARYCAPSFSSFHEERFKVIFQCVRRAIYTEPSLMLLAQKYKSVMSLLQDSVNLDVAIVEKLWQTISRLPVHDVRAAVDDVLRPRDSGDYVMVLGGRVYKDLDCSVWPFHAWGHLLAIFMCYSCVRSTCRTIDDILALTRFVMVMGGNLSQSRLQYQFDFEGARTLVMCGFIPNEITSTGPRREIHKQKCHFNKSCVHWQETLNSQVICAGLSLTDPKSQAFVNKCFKHPDFMVMVRKGKDGRLIKSSPRIWAVKSRDGHAKAELTNAPWDKMTYFKDTLIEETHPIVSVMGDKMEDCLQVAIIDVGDGEIQDLVLKVEKVWLEVYETDAVTGIVGAICEPLVEEGELEFKPNKVKGDFPLVPNLEQDVVKSYRRLWGVEPKSLADDEFRNVK